MTDFEFLSKFIAKIYSTYWLKLVQRGFIGNHNRNVHRFQIFFFRIRVRTFGHRRRMLQRSVGAFDPLQITKYFLYADIL